MRAVLLRSAIIAMVAVMAASVSACSEVSGVVVGNGTPPQNKQPPHVITRSHTETLTIGPNLPKAEVSQQCDGGERVVGGGFSLPFYEPLYPSASHPTANGWMAKFALPLAYPQMYIPTAEITIYAQCLVGGAGRVSIQSVSQDIPALTTETVVAQCPTGSTAVGGGYAIRDDVDTIIMDGFVYALGGGIFRNIDTHDVIAGATAFVICYNSTVSVSVEHDHAVELEAYVDLGSDGPSHPLGFQRAYYNDTCRPGTTMTDGGYASLGNNTAYHSLYAYTNGPDPQVSRWDIYMYSNNQPFPVGDGIYAEFACVAF
jgi:hypothetical protein